MNPIRHRFPRWAVILCVLAAALLLSAASPVAGGTEDAFPSLSWQGYTLTPMHYEYQDGGILVRVLCDKIPLPLLYDSRNQFRMSGADGGTVLNSSSIRVMEGTLQKNEILESCEFFDIVFADPGSLPKNLGGFTLSAEGLEEKVPFPPRGTDDLSRCGFRTESGLYVISLYTEDAGSFMLRKFGDEWKGRDIEMCLGGSPFPTFVQDFSTKRFLESGSFAHVALTLGPKLNLVQIEKSERITELTVSTDLLGSTMKKLKKLTFRLGEGGARSMPDFSEDYPGLTELCVICCVRDPGKEKPWNYMNESSQTHERVAAGLKKLTIVSPEESPFTFDPDVRIWLIAQREKTPGLQINGRPAREYDFVSDLPDEERQKLVLPEELKAVKKVYESAIRNKSLKNGELKPSDFKAPVYVVIEEYGTLYVSTDPKSMYSFSAVPEELKAASLGEARTLVFIYPTYRVTGAYYRSGSREKFADAETCDTNVAVLSYRDGKAKLVSHQVVESDSPPRSVSGYSDSTSGSYYPKSALKRIGELLQAG